MFAHRLALFLCVFSFLWSMPVSADVLVLKNGKTVPGEILKDSSSKVTFKGMDGKTKKYDKSKISRIKLTWAPPDLARTDPQWSVMMVEERKKKDLSHIDNDIDVLRTDHYIIFTNSPAGKKYMATMEDAYKKFKKLFPFDENEGDRLLPIFLFQSNGQYFEFCQNTAGMSLGQAKSTAGIAWKDFYASFYASPKDPVHYHEGAHQLVDNRLNISWGGSWFQEGLAVYFEIMLFPEERKLEAVRALAKGDRHTKFRELFTLRSLIFSSDATKSSSISGDRYSQSGAVIYFLKEGPRKDKFPEVLDAVRKYGRFTEWGKVIREVYDLSIDELEKEWVGFMEELKT